MSNEHCDHSHLDHTRPGNLCVACGERVEPPHADVVVQLVTYPSEIVYDDGERARYCVRIVNCYGARAASNILNTGYDYERLGVAEKVQHAMCAALRTVGIDTGVDFLEL